MNRKLHDTALALMVSGTLAALALIAGNPQPAPAVAVARASMHTAAVDPTVVSLRLSETRTGRSGRARRIRHSMAMPFFSFASRG